MLNVNVITVVSKLLSQRFPDDLERNLKDPLYLIKRHNAALMHDLSESVQGRLKTQLIESNTVLVIKIHLYPVSIRSAHIS